ncbi:CDP-alcohol phosphatidyltransferase family protein [Candidatus Parcubacteria bacterium]|nr:CDP-alcohol phosphatidyltransferase family protein [Candidatus Parcubacteria bacterium]
MSSKDEFYKRARKLVVSIAKKLPPQINPNTLTLLGLLFALLAGLSFALGEIIYAVVCMFISGFLDLLDGAVAKASDRETEFGEVLDSVSDRYSDTAIMIGIMWGYSFNLSALWFLVGFSAIVGSIMVSYTRAKGESVINEKITIGIADRPARTGLIIIGAIFGCMNYAILSVAFLTHFTVLQRMQFIRKKLKQNSG